MSGEQNCITEDLKYWGTFLESSVSHHGSQSGLGPLITMMLGVSVAYHAINK